MGVQSSFLQFSFLSFLPSQFLWLGLLLSNPSFKCGAPGAPATQHRFFCARMQPAGALTRVRVFITQTGIPKQIPSTWQERPFIKRLHLDVWRLSHLELFDSFSLIAWHNLPAPEECAGKHLPCWRMGAGGSCRDCH